MDQTTPNVRKAIVWTRQGIVYAFITLVVGFGLYPNRLLAQTIRSITDLHPGTLEHLIGTDSATIETLTISGGTLSLEDLQVVPRLKKLRQLSLQGAVLDELLSGTIPRGVFVDHPSLAELSLPDNTLVLASGACSSMPKLTTVILPEGLKNIEMSCFNSCTNLKTINFPRSLEVVGWSAFQGCTALKRVHLGVSLKELRGYAFNACSSIEEVIIDGSPANIGEHAFSSCSALQRVELNGDIREVRKFAFKEDSTLSEIRVNAIKVPKVGPSAFFHVREDCRTIVPRASLAKYKKAYGWKSLQLQGSRLSYTIKGRAGELSQRLVACNLVDTLNLSGELNASDLEYIKTCFKGLSHLNLKEVQMVAGGTFNGKEYKIDNQMPCQALSGMSITSVVLPDALEMIAERCFEGCAKLQQVTIGTETTRIQAGAFLKCTALQEIAFPDLVENLELSVLDSCEMLQKVILGPRITEIEDFAFSHCLSVREIYAKSETPANVVNAFNNEDGTSGVNLDSCVLYVPQKSISRYKEAEGWNAFKQIKVLPSAYTITMTTTAREGSYIMLSIESVGAVEIEGAELKFGGLAEVKSPQITIKGEVTGLDCSEANLTDLNISQMPTLTSLWCNNNALTQLDIRSLVDLKILYCTQNQLSELDVSANTKLTELDCSQNNLTQIDLTQCGSLTHFLAYHNQIKLIDLSNNPLLIGVDLSENKLTELSVDHNTKLETIYCNGNAIKEQSMEQLVASLPNRNNRVEFCNFFVIDSKNPNEQNVIYKNQVQIALGKHWQTLDYSAGDNDGAGINYEGEKDPVSHVESVVLKTEKEELSLTIGALSEEVLIDWGDGEWIRTTVSERGTVVKGTRKGSQIILSGVDITRLQCANNDLTELLLKEVPELQILHCYSNALTTIDLSKTPKVTELYMQDNKFQQIDLSALTQLNDLNASNNRLTTVSLECNKELVSLSLLGNLLTSIDLSSCLELEDVSLGYNQLTALDVTENTKLYWIIIYKNQFSEEAIKALFASLPIRSNKDGTFKLFESRDDEIPEGNKLNEDDLCIATDKGWKVMDGKKEITSVETPSRERDAIQLYRTERGVFVCAPFSCQIYSLEGQFLGDTIAPEDQLSEDLYPSVILLATPEGKVYKVLL